MNNKLLIISLILCNLQFVHSIYDTNKGFISRNLNKYNKVNIDKKLNNLFPNIKNILSNILTLSNNNGKCYLMSCWNILAQIYNHSSPDSEIRRTNFAEIIKLLGWNRRYNYKTKDNITEKRRSKSLVTPQSFTKRILEPNYKSIEYDNTKANDYIFYLLKIILHL